MAGDKYVPNGSTNGTKPPNGYLHSGLILHNGMKPPNGFKNTNGFKNSLNSLHSSGILTGSKGSVNGILRHKGEDQQMLKESEAFEDAISTESAESLRRRNIDSGYAWVVLLSAFMLNFFMSGQFGTLGIYLVEYFHYFDVGRAPISYIGACQMFVGYFLGLFNGALMKRFGCRIVTIISSLMVAGGYLVSAFFPNLWILYIFFGVISGVGFLNFYLVAIVAVQQYFDKRRAFATGICTSGLSVGIFVWSPFTRFLIDRYNWQGALVIQAGIFLNGIVFGALLRPPPPKPSPIVKTSNMMSELELSQKKKKKKFCCSLSFRQFLPFYIFLFGYFCIQLGHMTLYTYTPVKCDGIGMPRTKASFLISLMGITGIFARPVIGLLGDCRWANRTILIGISALGVGAATMVSTQLVSYVPLAIFSGTFGFLSSGYMALYGAALVDIVGLDNIAVTSGALMVSKGMANLMLHMMSGWLMDVTGDVNIPFLIFGAFQFMGGILIIPIPWITKLLRSRLTATNVTLESEIS